MTVEQQQAAEQQRLRRQRVNRIRNGIILTISLWMLISFIAIVSLTVAVVHLNSKVHQLEKKIGNQTVAPVETVGANPVDTTEVIPYANVVTGIDRPENFATEADTHLVYLTFDSQPGENTDDILRVLRSNNVKATFFVSGDITGENSEYYEKIVSEGHAIGMHSYSNQMSDIYSSTENFISDYNQIHDYILETTGVDSKLYRFPGGSGNEISNLNMAEFVHLLNEQNTVYYDWNVSAGDAAADYTTQNLVENVINGVSQYKTSVVLLHDDATKSTTVEALTPLIRELKGIGAEILPIDDTTMNIQYIHADSVE